MGAPCDGARCYRPVHRMSVLYREAAPNAGRARHGPISATLVVGNATREFKVQAVQLYAAILGLLFVGLSARTLRLRRTLRIAIGDGGNPILLRATRVHANFAEYVPLSLLLLYFLQSQGASGWFLHLLGAALLIGRIAHAYGVSQVNENGRFRVLGMALTLGVLITACARLLGSAAGVN